MAMGRDLCRAAIKFGKSSKIYDYITVRSACEGFLRREINFLYFTQEQAWCRNPLGMIKVSSDNIKTIR